MKRTKIVATIGPASESEIIMRKLFEYGVNVCRLNFSHGDHDEHKARIDTIKKLRQEMNLPIAIMLDTKGPEIRLGKFKKDQIKIQKDQEFILTTREIEGDENIVSVSYKGMPNDVSVGDIILIDDGLIEFRVVEIRDTDIIMKALNSGVLKDHKGVNIPNVSINLPALTERDVEDIIFGIENGIDYIAASFVRRASDVSEIRKVLEDNNGVNIDIIAKIENQQGLDNIDEILAAADGIMVARGDLGVEVPTEEIPLIQKELIRKCNIAGKPVITATQMLDSMIRNPRPTRAEVTDVANAIIDGSSAVMLSGETAAGQYPVEAVKTMYNIAVTTENALKFEEISKLRTMESEITTTNAISKATVATAQELGAKAIITATSSGYTSKAISKFRPRAPIIAVTTNESVLRKLSLVWGVIPMLSRQSESTDEVIELSVKTALDAGLVKEGDLVVITAGIPVGVAGTTNMIKVHTIGKVLLQGTGVGTKVGTGRVVIANTKEELLAKFVDGDIIVCKKTFESIEGYMKRASAIVCEEEGLSSHAAIMGLDLGIPTIVGAENATQVLKDNEIITVESSTGQIYKGHAKIL
jgi:pyruvate kinase